MSIAACNGLLQSKSASDRSTAIDRLLDLADVNEVGHYAAVEALNVLDMNTEITPDLKQRLAQLPRKVAKPPTRMGAYVGKLLNHAINGPNMGQRKKK